MLTCFGTSIPTYILLYTSFNVLFIVHVFTSPTTLAHLIPTFLHTIYTVALESTKILLVKDHAHKGELFHAKPRRVFVSNLW